MSTLGGLVTPLGETMRYFLFVLLFVCAAPAFAAPVAVESPRWQFEGAENKVVDYLGKHALYLYGANATLADANFDTGVIEFDMMLPDKKQSFPAVIFRGQDGGNYEHFYFRPHQNGNPDANQYTPVINGLTGWQIYSGTNYEAQITYPLNQWFHVKLEIADDSARVYIGSDQPTLVIHDLKRERKAGFISFKGSAGGAYFANIDIEPGHPAAASPEPTPTLPAGLVQAWAVSQPMAEADAFAAASANHLSAIAWTKLPVESNGIANLARVAVRTDQTPSVLARLSLRADRARRVAMRFGFSDRVQVYVNGTLLYAGDDSQYSRDYRFLGTVGFYDTLQLSLRRGDNDVVFVVSEGGGGWAANAAFPDMTGLTLQPGS
jgi:hypothetical protein